ncbi:hypothetical protein NADFUDRAFT_67251 [Nadsonia fulvescens var. elongata DSM 6958]|uniref:SURP motif domain-containing protein n=1 Tax=Nadsonia fulvescens var. elongata DSM 6958 TaxID=857566 RepID=A0A1E3PEM6_9ASCO|nr:hypothetical protein NADFUDRAFT_67251 [Nadsonia fulvescens var. elongata DSM 6958]
MGIKSGSGGRRRPRAFELIDKDDSEANERKKQEELDVRPDSVVRPNSSATFYPSVPLKTLAKEDVSMSLISKHKSTSSKVGGFTIGAPIPKSTLENNKPKLAFFNQDDEEEYSYGKSGFTIAETDTRMLEINSRMFIPKPLHNDRTRLATSNHLQTPKISITTKPSVVTSPTPLEFLLYVWHSHPLLGLSQLTAFLNHTVEQLGYSTDSILRVTSIKSNDSRSFEESDLKCFLVVFSSQIVLDKAQNIINDFYMGEGHRLVSDIKWPPSKTSSHSVAIVGRAKNDIMQSYEVNVPKDLMLLSSIHGVVEGILIYGANFETSVMSQERNNEKFEFLWGGPFHGYFKWKLLTLKASSSLCSSDQWQINQVSSVNSESNNEQVFTYSIESEIFSTKFIHPASPSSLQDLLDQELSKVNYTGYNSIENEYELPQPKIDSGGYIGTYAYKHLELLLYHLDSPRRGSIARVMVFCIGFPYAILESLNLIKSSIENLDTCDSITSDKINMKFWRLWVINDIIFNTMNCRLTINVQEQMEKGACDQPEPLMEAFNIVREILLQGASRQLLGEILIHFKLIWVEEKSKSKLNGEKFRTRVLQVIQTWTLFTSLQNNSESASNGAVTSAPMHQWGLDEFVGLFESPSLSRKSDDVDSHYLHRPRENNTIQEDAILSNKDIASPAPGIHDGLELSLEETKYYEDLLK